ncbi:MAG: hypothetical protein AAF600_05195 [Bacteroidota bacterium]
MSNRKSPTKQILLFLIWTIAHLSLMRGQNLKIGIENQTRKEELTRVKLTRVLEEYDVQKWIFVDTLRIAEREIPHSHPILTLNTRPQSDLSLLSVFIHENIHWFLEEKKEATDKAMDELKVLFKNVPVGYPEGAKSEHSTYLHLIVNYLEYDGIKQVAGERAAQAVFQRKTYYKWINLQVLANLEYLEKLIIKYQLKI